MGSSDPALMIGDFVVVAFSLIYDEISRGDVFSAAEYSELIFFFFAA